MLRLLHVPTLSTHFGVTNMRDFVQLDLISCINLKYLDIGNYTIGAAEFTFHAARPEHSIQLNESLAGIRSPTAIMKFAQLDILMDNRSSILGLCLSFPIT